MEGQGLEICIDQLPTILDSKLSWEQIFEIRKDKMAREKLERLRRWFTIDLLKKDSQEISSILEKRIDEYEWAWALKKHGIKTIIGGATSVLTFSVSSTALHLFNSIPLAAITGEVTLTSGVTAWVANKLIKKSEIVRDEIAYIYDVRKWINLKS